MSRSHWRFGLAAFIVITHALASAATCYDYVLISTRGTFEKQGPSEGFTGMINSTLSSFPNIIEYDTVYPASSNLSGAFKYALLGYSQGASVNNIALRSFTNTTSAAYKAILAVLVIGNPGHLYGAKANVDEYGGDRTRDFNGWVLLNGAGEIPDVYYADDKVLDICYEGDTVCAVPPNTTGGVSPPHLLYGTTPTVQTMGGEFLIEKLDQGTPSSNQTIDMPSNCSSAQSASSSVEPYTGSAGFITPSSVYGALLALAVISFAF